MSSNIVEQNIATPPASYEAYLYQYTNLSDGKAYVGIHKGSVDDPYNHSSTNVQPLFNKRRVSKSICQLKITIEI